MSKENGRMTVFLVHLRSARHLVRTPPGVSPLESYTQPRSTPLDVYTIWIWQATGYFPPPRPTSLVDTTKPVFVCTPLVAAQVLLHSLFTIACFHRRVESWWQRIRRVRRACNAQGDEKVTLVPRPSFFVRISS